MAVTPRIEMKEITKSFGRIQSLRGVNLELYPGEVLGLVGDNGAGKSTLMKVLSGVHYPDGGTMKFEGHSINLRSPKDAKKYQIETIFQDLALCDTLDVASNLFLGREPLRFFNRLIDTKKMHRDARRELDRLGVKIPSTYATVENLSGGQRQSVAIARAVMNNPKVLIMDEPTAALGVKEVRLVLELIKTVKRRGVSVILITHRLLDLFEVCDRITVLYEGRIIDNRPISDFTMESLVASITVEKEAIHS
ncbi:ATP-binding cassette domain-containing protein [Sporolactobacillus terrae]|uniref:ATP-binding cassette domain-containing protein n=1 Tax=Sporolactobacillus terrae TaxID=269673 RepID=UPI001C3F46B3|nr:ATP-binding cassette domain-containing protein [Sporolactobacillus terrae]